MVDKIDVCFDNAFKIAPDSASSPTNAAISDLTAISAFDLVLANYIYQAFNVQIMKIYIEIKKINRLINLNSNFCHFLC